MKIKDFIDLLQTDKNYTKSVSLNKTHVVADGHLLQRTLYRESSRSQGKDNLSTDYTTYAETIRKFFRRLKNCQITPIVVFNGTVNSVTYKKGFDSRIREIRDIYRNDYKSAGQSPTLLNYVFMSVVHDFEVDIIQNSVEVFKPMAMLAKELNCPIVSERTDFLFMGMELTLISGKEFVCWNQMVFDDYHKSWSLICDALCLDIFFKTYKGLRPQVMPLLKVVLENRFIDPQKHKQMSQEINGWHRPNDMDLILNWFKGMSLNEGLNSIQRHLKSRDFVEKIKEMVKQYQINDKDLIAKYWPKSNAEFDRPKMGAEGDVEMEFPKWFVEEYEKGIIRPALMNIVKLKTHILFPQMDDFSQPSSYECTLSLRRFLYAILRTDSNNESEILVMDRKNLERSEEKVTPFSYISKNREIPDLAAIRRLDMNERRALFLSVLGVKESHVNQIKTSLLMSDFSQEINSIDSTTFLIIILRFWINKNNDINWKPFAGALTLAFIYFSRRDLKTDEKWVNLCDAQTWKKFEPQCLHHFSQFQACLHIANFINSVLGFPFREGKAYYCLNGIFLYNATKRLSIDGEYELFLDHLFEEWPSMRSVFSQLSESIVFDLNVLSINFT